MQKITFISFLSSLGNFNISLYAELKINKLFSLSCKVFRQIQDEYSGKSDKRSSRVLKKQHWKYPYI